MGSVPSCDGNSNGYHGNRQWFSHCDGNSNLDFKFFPLPLLLQCEQTFTIKMGYMTAIYVKGYLLTVFLTPTAYGLFFLIKSIDTATNDR